MGFISWISPIKYSTFSFVANFSSTKSFGLSGWVMKSTPSSQSPSPVNLSDSWVVKSESDVSESVLYSFVTHVRTFFLGLGLGVPLVLLLAAVSWIPSFWGVRITIIYFPYSRPPLLRTLGAVIGYGWASSRVTFFSKELPTCAIDGVVKPTDHAVRIHG